MPAAAGQWPSRSGYSSGAGSRAARGRLRDPRHGPADGPPRVERPEDVAEQHAERHQREPEDHEDEGRREVGRGRLRARAARCRRRARAGTRPTAPQRISTGRLEQHAADAAGSGRNPRRPAAAARATAPRAPRTRPRAPSPRPSRTATRGSAGRCCRRCRGRSPASAGLDHQAADRAARARRRSAVWLSISNTPSTSALKRKRAGLPGAAFRLDVVAVQVDLVVGVGASPRCARVAVDRPDRLRVAIATPPFEADARTAGWASGSVAWWPPCRRSGVRLACRVVLAGLRSRRRHRAGPRKRHGDRQRDDDKPDSLMSGQPTAGGMAAPFGHESEHAPAMPRASLASCCRRRRRNRRRC